MQIGWDNLLSIVAGITQLTWANVLMIAVGGVLIYLAIAKEYEPVLLIPIGAGAILANIPGAGMGLDLRAIMAGQQHEGVFYALYKAGIETELFPLLLFIGIGAMTDFGPLLSNPRMVLVGAAGQFGIFGVLLLALASGRFTLNEAASIGIIGAIDGPTSIFVASKLAPHLLAPIAVCRLHLHEPGAHHPAAHHAPADHQGGAAHPHALHRAAGEQAHARPLPHRRHPADRLPGAAGQPADRHA